MAETITRNITPELTVELEVVQTGTTGWAINYPAADECIGMIQYGRPEGRLVGLGQDDEVISTTDEPGVNARIDLTNAVIWAYFEARAA